MSRRERILEAELRLLRQLTRSRCHRMNNHVTEASGHVMLMQGADPEEVLSRGERLGESWRGVSQEVRWLHESVRGAGSGGPWPLTVLRDDLVALSENLDGALGAVRVGEADGWGAYSEARRDVVTLAAFLVLELMATDAAEPYVTVEEGTGAATLLLRCRGDVTAAEPLADAAGHLEAHALSLAAASDGPDTVVRITT